MKKHNLGKQEPYPKTRTNHLRYLLYLPPKFNERPKKKWPLLCFLHGKGEAAINVNDKNEETRQHISTLMRHGSPSWHCAINSPMIRDFIVVSPQLPKTGYWLKHDLSAINEILIEICDEFADPKKIFLIGFSRGAKAVFEFVSKEMEHVFRSERIKPTASWLV